MLFCYSFHSLSGIFFTVGFTVKGVRKKFPADIGQEKIWQETKCVHLLFSVGLNILLCYKYFGLMVSKNFIAVALRG